MVNQINPCVAWQIVEGRCRINRKYYFDHWNPGQSVEEALKDTDYGPPGNSDWLVSSRGCGTSVEACNYYSYIYYREASFQENGTNGSGPSHVSQDCGLLTSPKERPTFRWTSKLAQCPVAMIVASHFTVPTVTPVTAQTWGQEMALTREKWSFMPVPPFAAMDSMIFLMKMPNLHHCAHLNSSLPAALCL